MALAVGIGLQNFPEGAAISLPLRQEGISTGRAFLYGALSGVVEPIFGISVVLAAGTITPFMPWLLSFAAGTMMYVVTEELIPEAHLGEHSNVGTLGVMGGFVVMMILVPPQIISIPQYMLFRHFGIGSLTVNLINTKLCMYLPAAMGNGIRAGLMIFIFRQFFKGLPKELEDAAYLDGCGPLRTFVQVMIPNASSSFLTVFLFSVVWYWNDYYVSSTFFTKNQTIALMLKNLSTLLSQQLFNNADVSPREQIVWMEAGCLIAILPILVMYTFLQKYFTEGIERSGLVG